MTTTPPTDRRHRLEPPTSLAHLHSRHPWIVPVTAACFVLLAIGAAFDWLPWDEPLARAAVRAREPWSDELARRVSYMGSTYVVLSVAACAAVAASLRSRSLAVAIVVIALARPLAEFTLKELIDRPRPVGNRLVAGTGPSFPSGHPLATAASWCLIPLVLELYTRRKALWWASVVVVWTLAAAVAVSRVWLGVHWPSDVVGGLLLAVLGVAAAEHVMDRAESRPNPGQRRRRRSAT